MKMKKTQDIACIDRFLEKNKDFWRDLEIYCVAECCGIDAFDFSRKNIEKTIPFYDSEAIQSDIKNAIDLINNTSAKLIYSTILNHCVSKKKFSILFENINQVLLGVSV